ncbi:MAG: inner membrane protein import complex subunit Tim54-domain-containing protein [Piptocephalis tieghemiana]|nr:MAG: inner membrane protein import complex subunit Tim54-domain-containing protein [Piptocephalis tieghemiana]
MSKAPPRRMLFGYKVPKPRTLAILGGLCGILALRYRSRYLENERRKHLLQEASVLSEVPVAPGERIRALRVFLTAPEQGGGVHNARAFFREYIKPVWDAAAMDYEVIECSSVGDVHDRVVSEVSRRRLRATGNDIKKKEEGEEEEEEVFPDGWVALGGSAWREMLAGLNEAYLLDLSAMQAEELKAEEAKQEARKRDAALGLEVDEEEEKEMAKEEKEKEVGKKRVLMASPEIPPGTTVPLGYLPLAHRAGWWFVPLLLQRWFVGHWWVEPIGQVALAIAREQARPMEEEDVIHPGGKGIDRVKEASGLAIVEENKSPEQLAEEALLLDVRIRDELMVYKGALE